MKLRAIRRSDDKVKLSIEPWECMALDGLQRWCHNCKAMKPFKLNDASWSWHCPDCGAKVIVQQLIIEGILSEDKYRGIENA